MFEWISEFISSSAPAEFESNYSLAESVSRLRLLVDEAFYGQVATKAVYFRGCIPVQDRQGRRGRGATQTCFDGEFQLRGGRVFLVGTFSLTLGVIAWVLGGFAALVATSLLAWFGQVGMDAPSMALLVFVVGDIAMWFARLDAKSQAESMARLITRSFS